MINCYRNYYSELILELKNKKLAKEKINRLKIRLCAKYSIKKIPTDIEVLLNADAKDIPKIKKYLLTKPTRTLSGVAVCAVMTKPIACRHGKCIYCPGGPDSVFGSVPQSYTGKEPATRRAIRNKFDPYLQVFNRLEQYVVSGHVPDKIELIIMGGTFPSFQKKYREYFIKYALKAMNDFSALFFKKNELNIPKFKKFFELPGDINNKKRLLRIHKRLLSLKINQLKNKSIIKKLSINKNIIKCQKFSIQSMTGGQNQSTPRLWKISEHAQEPPTVKPSSNIPPVFDWRFLTKENKKIKLEEEQLRNESSNIRCVGLTVESRPDYAKLLHANEMLRLGATRVELGVQTPYESVLKKIERKHTVKDSIESTRILKDLGFKISYHVMHGLPGVSLKKDLKAFKEYFINEDFRPDMLKIYPCMVLKGTKLYHLYKNRKFKPITTEKAAELIIKFKQFVPEYVRIMRVQRDIPTYMTEAGVNITNLRQKIQELMKERGIKCNCIRCREIGRATKPIKKADIKIKQYSASKGTEFFISMESNNYILGFCRLRFPSRQLRKEITKSSALIRELHVFGPSAAIGKRGLVQHKGIGKKLLKKAEEISKKYNKNKLVVISGIGARNYYRKVGYEREGHYMVKRM